MLPVARDVTLAQVQGFARSLYARGKIEALSYGNLGAPEAVAATRRAAAVLQTKAVPRGAVVEAPPARDAARPDGAHE